ncbi:MAG: hypothetical protein Fur0034_21170 [Desulfuromonadia bacterium]
MFSGITHMTTSFTTLRLQTADGGGSAVSASPSPPPTTPQEKSSGRAKESVTDSVTLSETARRLSGIEEAQKRQIAEKNDPRSIARKKEEEKRKSVSEMSVVELAKYFPPFLSPARRKEILEKYPFFRQQIEAMMVPPPFGYTPKTVRAAAAPPKPADQSDTVPTLS